MRLRIGLGIVSAMTAASALCQSPLLYVHSELTLSNRNGWTDTLQNINLSQNVPELSHTSGPVQYDPYTRANVSVFARRTGVQRVYGFVQQSASYRDFMFVGSPNVRDILTFQNASGPGYIRAYVWLATSAKTAGSAYIKSNGYVYVSQASSSANYDVAGEHYHSTFLPSPYDIRTFNQSGIYSTRLLACDFSQPVTLDYQLGAQAGSTCWGVPYGDVTFDSKAQLVAIECYDASGNLIANPGIVSQAGSTYANSNPGSSTTVLGVATFVESIPNSVSLTGTYFVRDSSGNETPLSTEQIGSTHSALFTSSLSGQYRIGCRIPGYLTRVSSPQTFAPGASLSVSLNMPAGDVDRDDEVGSSDFDIVVQKFGLASGDAGFDGAADIDKDGEIGSTDFDVVVRNFGLQGD